MGFVISVNSFNNNNLEGFITTNVTQIVTQKKTRPKGDKAGSKCHGGGGVVPWLMEVTIQNDFVLFSPDGLAGKAL